MSGIVTSKRTAVEATTGSDSTRDKLEAAQAPMPSTIAPASRGVGLQDTAAAPNPPTSTGAVTASSPPLDAKSYCGRAIAAYRDGDFPLALVDCDLAIRLDPNFEDASYRMREPDLAFDDVAQAMRIENSHRIATPPLPKASPLLK